MNIVSVRSFAESTPYLLLYGASCSINIEAKRSASPWGHFVPVLCSEDDPQFSFLPRQPLRAGTTRWRARIDRPKKPLGVAFALGSWLARGAANSFKH